MSVLHLPRDTRRPPAYPVLDRSDPINDRIHSVVPMDAGIGGGLRDLTGKHTITAAGTTPSTTITQEATSMGPALRFTGAVGEGYLSESYTAIAPPFTVSFWFKVEAWPTTLGHIWTAADSTAPSKLYRIYFDTLDKLNVATLNGVSTGTAAFDITALSGANTWIHVVGVWHSDSLREVYFNGAFGASNTTTVANPSPDAVAWNQAVDSTPAVGLVNGSLALGRSWDRALTENEIQRLYNEPWAGIVPRRRVYYSLPAMTQAAALFIPPNVRRAPTYPVLDRSDPINQGLRSLFPFSEGGGLTSHDLTGRVSGTLSGTPPPSWVQTDRGPALDSAAYASNDYYVDQSFKLIEPPFSVAVWIRVADGTPAATGYVWSIAKNSVNNVYHALILHISGEVRNVSFDSAAIGVGRSLITAPENEWFLAVGIWRSNSLRDAYINLSGSNDDTATVSPTGLNAIRWNGFAASSGLGGIAGQFMLARVWDRAISTEERQRLYNEPWAGIVPQRRVYYSLPTGGLNQIRYGLHQIEYGIGGHMSQQLSGVLAG